jgi:hypothetical protein
MSVSSLKSFIAYRSRAFFAFKDAGYSQSGSRPRFPEAGTMQTPDLQDSGGIQ